MCTVTVIPLAVEGDKRPGGRGAFRLVTNRDESRRRAPALPPQHVRLAGGIEAVWPVDPTGGGTWIAGSTRGLVLAATNINPRPAVAGNGRAGRSSRGLLIPDLIDAARAPEAIARLHTMDLSVFPPFRLIAVDGVAIVAAVWADEVLRIAERALGPVCYVSSGLGDDVVADRLPLFDAMLTDQGPTPAMQDAFHRHRWPDRPEASVLMSRAEARTVSTTIVEVREAAVGAMVLMDYRDDAGVYRVRAPQGTRAGTVADPCAVAGPAR